MLQHYHSHGDGKEILVQIVDALASEPKDRTPKEGSDSPARAKRKLRGSSTSTAGEREVGWGRLAMEL